MALTLCGYILGFLERYMHEVRYRIFNTGPHRRNAKVLFAAMIVQLVLGVYLKLRIHEGRAREWAVRMHGAVGTSIPILGWTQILCGVIASQSYCRGDTNRDYCITFYGMVRVAALYFHQMVPQIICCVGNRVLGIFGSHCNHGGHRTKLAPSKW